ncbi:MAG: hypothetical protein WC869_03820 [Phycisphaerae bacterium]|jgi:hypothetical protein
MLRNTHKAFVSVLALFLVCVLVALAVASFGSTSMGLAMASNQNGAMATRLAAESGLSFISYEVAHSGVNGCLRGKGLLDALATRLKADLNGTTNLKGATVGYDGTTITVPEISIGDGSFTVAATQLSYDTVRLAVTGYHNSGAGSARTQLTRTITLDYQATGNPAFGYGICSKGPITMDMNTYIMGVVDPDDGSVYSSATGTAITDGSGRITGDVVTSDPNATLSMGKTQIDGDILSNIPPITMPELLRSVYTVFATNIVDSSTDFSSGTFKNIRIRANTNPIFGAVTIQGVMYIEAPNYIQFNNNATLTCVMVADDPPTGSPDSANYISFNNNARIENIDQLPDTSEFTQLRKLGGTSVLAPGFTMEFKNNAFSIAGTVAVKSMIAKNNMCSTVDGGLLIYGNTGLSLKNNFTFKVDRSKNAGVPRGFQGYGQALLVAKAESYTEK